MGVQHRVIHILRAIHKKLRQMSLNFLGINELVTHNLLVGPAVDVPVGEAFQRLVDRICILESHVNWRLYGLPATVGNIKLEQTGILANSLELEELVSKLADLFCNTNECQLANSLGFKFDCNCLIVSSKGLKDINRDSNTVILDTEDLFLPSYEALVRKHSNKEYIAPVLTVLSASSNGSFESVWLSNVCERVHPVKALLILKHAARVVKPGGIVAGYFNTDQTQDPRVLKTFRADLFNQLGLHSSSILVKDGGFVLKV